MLGEKLNDQLLDKNILFLTGEINQTSTEAILKQILRIHLKFQEECTPLIRRKIVLFINSHGGSVTQGCAIIDALQATSAEITTVVTGEALSMGAFVLASGTKGKRFAFPNAEVMLHQVVGMAQGQATDILIRTENIVQTKKRVNELLALYTGQKLEKISYDLERDFFLTSEQALEYGLIDRILENYKEIFEEDDVF